MDAANGRFARWHKAQEKRLERTIYVALPKGEDNLSAAMRYAVAGKGKKLRPLLCLAAAHAIGRSQGAIHAACAVELVHSYSLLHDDLPCMDDDDMRRGRPSCHRKFNEATALLAGDALLTLAFFQLAKARLGDSAHAVLAEAIGFSGMVGGQAMDIEMLATTEPKLRLMHGMKTGSLIEASVVLGAMCANASKKQRELLGAFGRRLGLAYQIADDIKDATGTFKSTGKRVGQDRCRGKKTMVTMIGVEKARQRLDREIKKIKNHLNAIPNDTIHLRGMVHSAFS